MTRKMIIGYEPTDQGRDALELGRLLAELTASSPLVAMAFPWPRDLMTSSELESELAVVSASPLAAAADALAPLEVETRAVADQSPAGALADLADTEQAALIVIGSSHRGRIGQSLLGGTGSSLVHGAPCAIAVAPRGYAQRGKRRALHFGVAFDGSPESWSALETAIGLAERAHGQVTVLTVADYPHYGYAAAWSVLSAGDLRDSEHESKQRLLDLALSRCPAGLESRGRLLTGDPGTLLAEASPEFDLLVTGSRGYGPLRRTLLGSATRRLVSGAACPVLVLPRATASDPLGLRARQTSLASAA